MSRSRLESSSSRNSTEDLGLSSVKGTKYTLDTDGRQHHERCALRDMSMASGSVSHLHRLQLAPQHSPLETGPVYSKTVAGFAEHAESVMRLLHGMWETRHLCDMVINVEGEALPVHRLALAACSETFKSKLCNQQPNDIKELIVSDTTVEATELVLRYMYTLELSLHEEILEAVLSCSLQLGITTVVEACKSYLLQFNLDTAMRYIEISEKFQLLDVLSQIHGFVCLHFLEIAGSQEFLEYDPDALCRLLSDDNLVVVSELDVFLAVQRWIEHSMEDRIKFTIDLVKLVRFVHISPEDIALHVENCSYIFQIPECHGMLFSAFRYQALRGSGSYLANTIQVPSQRRMQPNGQITRGPSISVKNENKSSNCISDGPERMASVPTTGKSTSMILAIGGLNPAELCSNRVSRLVNEYNPLTNSWATLTNLPDRRHHKGAVIMAGELYILGGSTMERNDTGLTGHQNPTNSCYKFDLASHNWSQVPALKSKRVYHSTVTYNNAIYVLGGQDDHGKSLNTVECFDLATNTWSMLPAMSGAKAGATSVVFQNTIFVIGGFRETAVSRRPLSTVECYDPIRRCWIEKRPFPTPCSHACAVVVSGSMLVIGGAAVDNPDGPMCSLPSIYHYMPENDNWRFFTNLHVPRHSAAAVSLGSHVYVLGGLTTSNNEVLSSVECLDIANGSWIREVKDLPQPLLALCTCVSTGAEELISGQDLEF